MSVKRTLRRLTKNLIKAGHITPENEKFTMALVSLGAKGYDGKWPTRPFHQRNGSMRRKRAIQHFVNGQADTCVELFTDVYPTTVGQGPMTINADGVVNVEMNFDYAAAVVNEHSPSLALAAAAIEAGIKNLHEAGAISAAELKNGMEMLTLGPKQALVVALDENGQPVPFPTIQQEHVSPDSLPLNELVAKDGIRLWGQKTPVDPKAPYSFLDPLMVVPTPEALKAAMEASPLETFIAVDPGTPGYPDRAVAAQFSRDPATGQVTLVSTSIVAPPAEGSEVGSEFIYMPEVDGGKSVTAFMDSWIKQAEASAQEPAVAATPSNGDLLYKALGGPDVPDGERDYQNIWEGQAADPNSTYMKHHLPAASVKTLTETMDERGSLLADFKKQYKQAATEVPVTTDGKPDQVHEEPADPQEHYKQQMIAEVNVTLEGILTGLNVVPVDNIESLPAQGDPKLSYYLKDVDMFVRWDSGQFMPVQPMSKEAAQMIQQAFPEANLLQVEQELETPAPEDNRSWGRRLWDKITGKNRA